jgi:ABC-2 type transport system ATP-binding protein
MSVLNWSGILSAPLARAALEEPAEELVLDVRDLRMRYGRTDVLNGVTFSARRGEVLALLGPNGAGKTTTIEILEGFRKRSAGCVSVLGADPEDAGEAWRARIGVVLQSWRDHSKWQVRELLTHLGSYYAPYAAPGRPRPWDVDELLVTVGLTGQARRRVRRLSGGQRRRLDVAIGIVGRPELLFLDTYMAMVRQAEAGGSGTGLTGEAAVRTLSVVAR